MAGFKRSVHIQRPVEEVFDFATDLKNASIFLPDVTKTELLPPGEMKAGARFKETRKGRTAIIEVTEHRRPELYAAGAAMMGMRGIFLWWLFLGMMSRMMEKEDGPYLDRLKAAMESRPPS
jgi:hypothetical protein